MDEPSLVIEFAQETTRVGIVDTVVATNVNGNLIEFETAGGLALVMIMPAEIDLFAQGITELLAVPRWAVMAVGAVAMDEGDAYRVWPGGTFAGCRASEGAADEQSASQLPWSIFGMAGAQSKRVTFGWALNDGVRTWIVSTPSPHHRPLQTRSWWSRMGRSSRHPPP